MTDVSVSFEEERYILQESNSDGTDGNVSVCIKLEGKTQRPVSVNVSTSQCGTARGLHTKKSANLLFSFLTLDGEDYCPFDNMEITLAPDASPWNEVDGDTQCFNVSAKDDDIKEHLYENFCVEFVGYDDCVYIEELATEIAISEDDDGK